MFEGIENTQHGKAARADAQASPGDPGGGTVGVVVRSMELERVLALPRRILDLTRAPDVTPLYRVPGGSMSLWPIQSAALCEAAESNGLLAPIGVGGGKSILSYLLADAMDSKIAVLLVPPELRDKARREIPEYLKHFKIPTDRLHIVAYTELSSAGQADVLERLGPDLIIADECQHLRNFGAARTKRFARYFRRNPACRFAGMSGSVTKRSLVDYGHLAELALRKNSPLPRGYHELRDWAGALDAKPEVPMHPGALRRFCSSETETPREGFRRRLTETLGVVATGKERLDTGLVIKKPIEIKIPIEVANKRIEVEKTWALDGEEFDQALALHRVLRQLACGFYYKWATPPNPAWLEARNAWHSEVRRFLAHASREGLDSPLLLARAAASGRWQSETWAAWSAVRELPPPPIKAVWLSDFLVDAAVKWSWEIPESDGGSIIWYEHVAVGEAIAQLGGYPLYDGGADAETATAPTIVCSIKAQGTGKNLQGRYAHNLFTSMPAGGLEFEQVVGRTHRPGQTRDEVTVSWFGHTPEMLKAFASVISDSEYVRGTTGQEYKILQATRE